MPTTETLTVGPTIWPELFALVRSKGQQRAYLERLVELWRRAREARGAALYLERDDGYWREISVGEGRFPETLGEGRPAGFAALPLPGRLLLATEPADGPPPASNPLSVALASSVRALRLERQLKEKHF